MRLVKFENGLLRYFHVVLFVWGFFCEDGTHGSASAAQTVLKSLIYVIP